MKSTRPMHWLLAALIIMTLSGCGSIRYTSTIKPSGDKDLRIGSARYCLSTFSYGTPSGAMGQPDPVTIYQRAKILYPNIFVDEWTALPVMVSIKESYDQSSYNTSSMITGLSIGIIPLNGKKRYVFTIDASVADTLGQRLHDKQATFEIDHVEWGAMFPYGLLPAPGPSDLPRDYYFAMSAGDYSAKARTKVYNYAADCIVETVVQGLRTADQAKLSAAYQARQAFQQEVSIEGKKYWSYLTMTPATKDRGAEFRVLLYQGIPQRVVKPLEEAVVARQDESGRWRPLSGYLRTARSLTAASVLMENNVPSKVVVRAVAEPPLKDFIDTPDLTVMDHNEILRWNNGILLDAKNRSLDRVLREDNREDLLALVTRIEQAILDLSEQAERAKDRAQSIVEKGQGDPAPERELAVLCRQRIEVLKPILGAIKQQTALMKP